MPIDFHRFSVQDFKSIFCNFVRGLLSFTLVGSLALLGACVEVSDKPPSAPTDTSQDPAESPVPAEILTSPTPIPAPDPDPDPIPTSVPSPSVVVENEPIQVPPPSSIEGGATPLAPARNLALPEYLSTQSDATRIVEVQEFGRLVILVEENEQMEKYDIVILQNAPLAPLQIARNGGIVDFPAQAQTRWSEVHNQWLEFSVHEILNTLPTKLAQVKIWIPQDWNVLASLPLAQNLELKVRRLHLAPGVVITTSQYDLNIEAHKIVAENATIESFPETQRAPVGSPGRSGGFWKLRAKYAVGGIHFALRGENGGDGSAGLGWSTPAANGGPGVNAVGICPWNSCVCVEQATDGGRGTDGNAGAPGQNGLPGGNTPSLEFQTLLEDSNFHYSTEMRSGAGGRGGSGSPGQAGGAGGPPGANIFFCGYVAKPGPPGATGPQGPAGLDGPYGLNQKACWQNSQGHEVCQ